mmetsp:Transcript_41067/g.67535  ORF Transcript_41067/g.67535 Transcript_41067/m.67535 type:complete len:463 (+) Transcript_41067:607-1995(+)
MSHHLLQILAFLFRLFQHPLQGLLIVDPTDIGGRAHHRKYLVQLIEVVGARKQRTPQHHLRENAAHAPNVHLLVVATAAAHHLGRAIPARTHILRGFRTALWVVLAVGAQHTARQSKVDNLNVAILAIEQDVLRLNIAMNHARLVNKFETAQYLIRNVLVVQIAELLVRRNNLAQIALQQGHHQIHVLEVLNVAHGRRNRIINLNQVRMSILVVVQQEFDLAQDATRIANVGEHAFVLLDGHSLLGALVNRLAHNSVRAAANQTNRLVVAVQLEHFVANAILALLIGRHHLIVELFRSVRAFGVIMIDCTAYSIGRRQIEFITRRRWLCLLCLCRRFLSAGTVFRLDKLAVRFIHSESLVGHIRRRFAHHTRLDIFETTLIRCRRLSMTLLRLRFGVGFGRASTIFFVLLAVWFLRPRSQWLHTVTFQMRRILLARCGRMQHVRAGMSMIMIFRLDLRGFIL